MSKTKWFGRRKISEISAQTGPMMVCIIINVLILCGQQRSKHINTSQILIGSGIDAVNHLFFDQNTAP